MKDFQTTILKTNILKQDIQHQNNSKEESRMSQLEREKTEINIIIELSTPIVMDPTSILIIYPIEIIKNPYEQKKYFSPPQLSLF